MKLNFDGSNNLINLNIFLDQVTTTPSATTSLTPTTTTTPTTTMTPGTVCSKNNLDVLVIK